MKITELCFYKEENNIKNKNEFLRKVRCFLQNQGYISHKITIFIIEIAKVISDLICNKHK